MSGQVRTTNILAYLEMCTKWRLAPWTCLVFREEGLRVLRVEWAAFVTLLTQGFSKWGHHQGALGWPQKIGEKTNKIQINNT